MNKENIKNFPSCGFRAVENFLRRVAYNLGNTQSKTEVKIISCIPIDVTDLQQRIFQLQNELADIKEKAAETPKFCSICAKRRTGEHSSKQVLCNECLLSSTSVLSVFCPGRSALQLRQSLSVVPSGSVSSASPTPNTDEPTKIRSFFAKKKPSKKKVKTRLVYRAQTDTNTPFRTKLQSSDAPGPMKVKAINKSEKSNQSYLANVIERQYMQQPFMSEFSSDISSPVCRDRVPTNSPTLPHFESDVCSCIHGQFQNIDHYLNSKHCNYNKYATYEVAGTSNRNAYYDSKFYDLIPVKEKKIKNRNDIDKHKGRESKKHYIKCWPENARPKHDKYAFPTIVNYCTVRSSRDERVRPPDPPDKYVVMNRMAGRRIAASTPRRVNDIELGPVYAKKRNVITVNKQHNDAATGSAGEDIPGRQTATSAATITDPPEDKTETTLNQIKNMLQSVLTEVKINSNITKPPEQPKKEAGVQNGPTRGYEYGASQLLQSYTYSPYNMNPYIPSCSHPLSYPEYSNTKGIPFQQYPLLIQPQKPLCNNYYRNNNYTKPVTKQAATAATNTEQIQERSKETEQLIKEIYKSMALSMEDSSKDNSIGEYIRPKSPENKYSDAMKTDSEKESRNIAQAISEIFKNTHPRDSTVTGTTDTTLNSYLNPKKEQIISDSSATKDNNTERYYSQNKPTKNRREQETKQMSTHHEAEEQSDDSDDTICGTDESSSETDTVEVAVKKEPVKPTEPKKEKSGIFKKMLKMFQQKRRRRRNGDDGNESEKESESDSDDYQTVYSHKEVDATPKQKKTQIARSRPHSKVFYSKQPQKRRSRTKSPEKQAKTTAYMEQEYRRYWDEKLMFQENHRPRYSTGPSRHTTDRSQKHRNAYYQYYDARPVFVDNQDRINQVPLRMPGNVLKPCFPTNKYQYARQNKKYYANRPNNQGYANYQNNPYCVKNNTNAGATSPNFATGPSYISGSAGPHYSAGTSRPQYSGIAGPQYTAGTSGTHYAAGTSRPHFATSKNNGNRKGIFAKGLLKKCKPCAQQWREFIVNG